MMMAQIFIPMVLLILTDVLKCSGKYAKQERIVHVLI